MYGAACEPVPDVSLPDSLFAYQTSRPAPVCAATVVVGAKVAGTVVVDDDVVLVVVDATVVDVVLVVDVDATVVDVVLVVDEVVVVGT